MNPKEVDLRAIGDEANKSLAQFLLSVSKLQKDYREIELFLDEHLSFHHDPFVNELILLNKALAKNAADAELMLKEVVELIPTIQYSEKTKVELLLRREKKAALAKAGASGARSTHSKQHALKEWAEREAAGRSDKATARKLAWRAPEHLVKESGSDDPVRLIYEHLRKIAKRNTAS